MVAANDNWFVRFPDGRVIRAANTTVVRQNIQQHLIPFGSMVRRLGTDNWRPYERTFEFADLLESRNGGAPHERRLANGAAVESDSAAGGVGSSLDPKRLGTAGVQSVLQEMLAALDASLMRRKLIAAALLALFGGVILVAARTAVSVAPQESILVWPLSGLLFLLVSSVSLGLLAKLTNVELQRMRPALWKDGRAGLLGLTWRLMLANGAVAVVVAGLPALLLGLSRWLLARTGTSLESLFADLAQATGILAILATAILAPLAVAALMIGPILVFENASVVQTMRMWFALVRQHFGRVVLNEAAAVLMGILLSLPFLLPVLAAAYLPLDARLAVAGGHTRTLLACLALTPAIAFLAVANVFLFVNLRYETGRRS